MTGHFIEIKPVPTPPKRLVRRVVGEAVLPVFKDISLKMIY